MSNPKPILHFIPGEIVFRVDHEYGDERAAASDIRIRLTARYDNHEGGLEGIVFSEDRIVTFDRGSTLGCWYRLLLLLWKILQIILWIVPGRFVPRLPRWLPTRYFSVVFAEVSELGFDPLGANPVLHVNPLKHVELVKKIKRLDDHAALPIYRLGAAEADIVSSRPPEHMEHMDTHGRSYWERLTHGFVHYVIPPPVLEVKAATFNWLGGAAPGQGIPTGGPGAQPQPPGSTTSAGTRVEGLQIYGLDTSVNIEVETIKVMVLDTRPQISSDDLEDCFRPNPAPDTPLIRWLLLNSLQAQARTSTFLAHRNTTIVGDNLPVNTANAAGMSKDLAEWLNDNLTGIDIRGHEYDMSPHGTFAADILCGVVEDKGFTLELQVVEVLSKWGVGTMETIIRGLKEVYDQALIPATPPIPIIVNCSFTIQIPRLKEDWPHPLPVGTGEGQFRNRLEVLLRTYGAENRIVSIMQPIFELLHQKDVWMVAAAGNDRPQGQGGRPSARYPAAVEKVIGVSALSERGVTAFDSASYSDAADEPENDGFAVYGGDVDQANPTQTDPSNGMLGLYYTDIPDASGKPSTHPSKTGYLALWAGTSFAAPIITGALAILRAQGKNREEAIESLQKISGGRVDNDKELVIHVL